jgi:hypothetical protein
MRDSRVLRKLFNPKIGEATGDGKILHNEELYNLNSQHTLSGFYNKEGLDG